MPATPNARRPKVRCPKCTAIFSEPANSVFECPICSCRLSADGLTPSPFVLNQWGKDKALMLEKTVNRSDQKSRVPSGTCLRENYATYQDMHPQVSEESRGALLTRVCQEGQGPGAADEKSHGVCETSLDQEILLKDGSVEGVHGNKENTTYETSLTANNLAVVNAEAIEGEDSFEIGGSRPRQWDLRSLQPSRCELSFKYSLESANHVESDIERKRLPQSKFLSSMLNTKGSEAPLQIPLRVRIASRREESSDHSENGIYSFSSETETHDGSESDFDFPSPWANGVHDNGLPDSLGQHESVGHFSEKKLSACPHLLELCDAHEIPNKGQDIIDKFSKHVGESDIKFSLQAGDGSHLVSPSKNMNEQKENEKTCRYDLLSQVKDLTNIMSHAVTFDSNRNPTGDSCANSLLNQSDTSSLSRLHIQHVSYEGPSKPCFQASDDFDNKQVAGSHSNGKTSSFLPGDLAGLHSLDRSKSDKVIPTHTEAHPRDDNTCDQGIDLLPDIDVELDLYNHQEIEEWHDEQAVDPASSAYHYELKYERHDIDLRQMEVHRSAFSKNSLGRIFLPDSLPPSQQLLGDHKFDASTSEQIYQVPSQSLMLPGSFQLPSMAPYEFHSVPNGCTICPHHWSCMETHSGSQCMVCASCPGSATCSLGHCTRWNCCQPIDCLETAFTSCLVPCTGELTNLNQSHDLLSADMQWKAHLPGKISQYPPLPKDGAAPYVLCNACATVLQVPSKLPPSSGCVQKLRCSKCGRVNKFSVTHCIKQRHGLLNLLLPEMSSINGVRVPYNLHLVQWNPGGLDCSDNHRVPPTSGWQHEGSSGKTSCQDTTTHVSTSRSRALPLSLQEGDHLTVRQSEFAVDACINKGLGFRADISDVAICVSSEDAVSGLCEDIEGGQRVTPDTSLHGTMDEKDEELGFGAPRISDGESLDLIENGMGSSHNLQILGTFPGVLEDDPPEPKVCHDQKQRGLPLLVLLNQESTRFSLSLDPTPLFEEVKSVSWSPVLDSHIPNFVKRKDQSSSRSSKGPKYLTVWLRRSLRDFAKGRE